MTLPIPKQRMPVTATKMARAVRNTTIPVTRTSDNSYPADVSISSGWGPCEPSSSSLCCGMFRLQNFCSMRIVDLDQRPGLQLRAEIRQPEADQRRRHGNVFENAPGEVEVPRRVFEVRLNQPEQVERLGENHPLANPDQPLLV